MHVVDQESIEGWVAEEAGELKDDGNVVAVKRLKEVSVGGKRELQQRMEVLGRLRHCNVVPLRAYYFAKDEKLLVSDYMPNGNLSWLLHGNFLTSFYYNLLNFFFFSF